MPLLTLHKVGITYNYYNYDCQYSINIGDFSAKVLIKHLYNLIIVIFIIITLSLESEAKVI